MIPHASIYRPGEKKAAEKPGTQSWSQRSPGRMWATPRQKRSSLEKELAPKTKVYTGLGVLLRVHRFHSPPSCTWNTMSWLCTASMLTYRLDNNNSNSNSNSNSNNNNNNSLQARLMWGTCSLMPISTLIYSISLSLSVTAHITYHLKTLVAEYGDKWSHGVSVLSCG